MNVNAVEDSRLQRIQELWRAVADAEEAERAARATRAEARKKVLAAKQALDNYIAEAARPLPLFEQAQANGNGERKRPDMTSPERGKREAHRRKKLYGPGP